jgi:hypothetical protein
MNHICIESCEDIEKQLLLKGAKAKDIEKQLLLERGQGEGHREAAFSRKGPR